ncbi:unnamed protein product [Arctogadus glacialis]
MEPTGPGQLGGGVRPPGVKGQAARPPGVVWGKCVRFYAYAKHTSCDSQQKRYKDYREPPWSIEAYQFSKQYWCVLAARLAFVILFQNLVMFLSLLVAWLIPDVPKPIVEQLKREKTLLVDVFLREEKEKYQLIHSLFATGPPGPQGLLPLAPPGAALSPLHPRPPAGPQEPGGRYSTLPSGDPGPGTPAGSPSPGPDAGPPASARPSRRGPRGRPGHPPKRQQVQAHSPDMCSTQSPYPGRFP